MARYNASIYIDSGALISFECDKISCKKNVTGEFVELLWENMNIAMLSISLAHVIAITAKEIVQ